MPPPIVEFTKTVPYSMYAVPRAPRVFHLGMRRGDGKRGISIVDQIQLAQRFIKGAAKAKVLGPERPVLIFGAGAAGAAAAMVAAHYGIESTVREKSSIPFGPQARSQTRWLHPHQYDWPHDGWNDDQFVGVESGILRWRAADAPDVASQLTKQFQEIAGNTLLTFEANVAAVRLPMRKKSWDSLPERDRRQRYIERYDAFRRNEDPERRFALYLMCTGFGRENCSLPPFEAFPFWSTDPIPADDFGIKAGAPRILISGGGDGAQQDLLRLAFKATPLDLLTAIITAASAKKSGAIWAEQFASNVDTLQGRGHGSQNAAKLFEHVVSEIPPDVWDRMKERLGSLLRPEFLRSTVSFVFPNSYLPKCYALNRILVLALRRLLLEDSHTDIFVRNTTVGANAPGNPPHAKCGQPTVCWGKPHTVQLHGPNGASSATYDLLIVRHGLHHV